MLSKKQLMAVYWVIRNIKGQAESYAAESAKENIDSFYSFEITGREKDKIHHGDVFFGLPVAWHGWHAARADLIRIFIGSGFPTK
jgi:hypothetical protein